MRRSEKRNNQAEVVFHWRHEYQILDDQLTSHLEYAISAVVLAPRCRGCKNGVCN